MNRHHIARLLRSSTLSLGTFVLLLKGMLPTEVLAAETATPAGQAESGADGSREISG